MTEQARVVIASLCDVYEGACSVCQDWDKVSVNNTYSRLVQHRYGPAQVSLHHRYMSRWHWCHQFVTRQHGVAQSDTQSLYMGHKQRLSGEGSSINLQAKLCFHELIWSFICVLNANILMYRNWKLDRSCCCRVTPCTGLFCSHSHIMKRTKTTHFTAKNNYDLLQPRPYFGSFGQQRKKHERSCDHAGNQAKRSGRLSKPSRSKYP